MKEFEGVNISELMAKNSPCGGCPFASSGCAPCKPEVTATIANSPVRPPAFMAQERLRMKETQRFIRAEKWCSKCFKNHRSESCPHCGGKG